MSFRIIFLLLLSCSLLQTNVYGQNKAAADSIRNARQQALNEARAAQRKSIDSARVARQKTLDSLKTARKIVADSLAAIRKHRASKQYKDSIANARQHRVDSIRAERLARFDSLKSIRQHTTDSLIAARKKTTDSIKAIQKKRSDSLAIIRKYKESKRYKDSVALVRQIKIDSAKVARKIINDKMVTARKKTADSAAAIRKATRDSITTVRTKYTDSIKTVRKARAEELAKEKIKKEGLKKSREKKKEEKFKLALELKIKKKRKAWSNEKMLKKKWSVPRKVLQNTYTHYNYYFNADKKMDEALANMQRMRKENYDSLLALFPFDPDRDSTALLADMDSIVQKASVGIQIHDPRTKWADDLYLLLGEAYYYKGNYEEATTSFKYIISMNQQRKAEEEKKAAAKRKTITKDNSIVVADEKKALDFLKHKSVNNEAILWLARTYTEAHKEEQAETILELLESDSKLPDEIKGRLALEKAYLNLSRGNYKAASEQLVTVAADEHLPEWLRLRAAYLNGQLLYDQRNYAAAAANFQQVVDMNPKIEMDFYARKNLAYSLMAQGGSQETATASLKKLLKDAKYLQYNEQVYYVLGRLSANNNKPDDAIMYLQKSIESPKSTRKQKALSFASLGNVYYSKKDYKSAKFAYDSASSFARNAPNDSLIITAVKRASVLDKITIPLQTITDQDSLLALALLNDKEQRAVVRHYIRLLENKREDSINRASNTEGIIKQPQEEADPGNAGNNWYFSSTVLMQQGINDFKRKWGTRQNVDNWRRVGGMAFTNNNAAGGTNNYSDQEAESAGVDESGLPTENSLLAAIPNNAESKVLANQRIQKAYIDLANAYIKELEDLPSGIEALDTLDKRYTNHDHKAEDLFLRYQVALKQNNLEEARQLSDRIIKEHRNTKWAKEVAPSTDTKGLLASNGIPVADYYDATYGLMMQRQYEDVLQRVRAGQKQYNDPVYSNRFRIMEAIALAGAGSYNEADTLLTNFISTHPSDSLRSWAEAIMNYVKKNKPVTPPPVTIPDTTQKISGEHAIPPQPKITPTPDSASVPVLIPSTYSYKPKDEHYFVFSFNKMESKALGFKAALNDFNTFNYNAQKLNSNMDMLQPTQGIIVIKSFPSATHAKIYLNAIKSNNLLLKEYKPEEYQLMIISADNYKKLAADRDIIPYTKFYKAYYK